MTQRKGNQAKAKAPTQKRKPGRPTVYTEAVGNEICDRIMLGESLRSICESTKNLPDRVTVLRWLMRGEPEEFCHQYERARQIQAETLADDLQEIADDGRNDWMEVHDKDGDCIGYKINGEAVQRSKLRADTRKWVAERLLPRKYGSLIKHADHTGEAPAQFVVNMPDGD